MQNSDEPSWQFQYSVDCNATRHFAWSYWTNIANWNDPPATFALDGPFDVGSCIITTLPGQTLHSVIRSLSPESLATIEMQLPDATLSFHWTFENSLQPEPASPSASSYPVRTPSRLLRKPPSSNKPSPTA